MWAVYCYCKTDQAGAFKHLQPLVLKMSITKTNAYENDPDKKKHTWKKILPIFSSDGKEGFSSLFSISYQTKQRKQFKSEKNDVLAHQKEKRKSSLAPQGFRREETVQ